MILHYTSISPRSRRVLAVAYELGYEPTLRETDPDSEELQKLNPNGMVPVLEDGDFVLWESGAIAQYLASKLGESALFPADPRLRAEIARWQFWTAEHFEVAAGPLLWENAFKPAFTGQGPDAEAVARAEAAFHPVARIADDWLAKRAYLAGSRLTIADFSLAGFLMFTEEARIPLEKHPHLARWFAQVGELPSWRRAGERIPGIQGRKFY